MNRTNSNFLLMLKSAGISESEPDLGAKLMSAFLTSLLESDELPAHIICLNSGVFLTTEGSPVTAQLSEFEKRGTEVLSCATCLNSFDRADKLIVGAATNMKETVAATLKHPKVVTL